MTGSLSARQAALFVAVIACVAFVNSFGGRFIFDDIYEIEQNPSMERLLPPWDAMFVGNVMPARPIPYLTFAIDHAIWGNTPFGYHITNLLVHVIAALALFQLVRLTLLSPRLRGRWGDQAVPLAMVIAMIWAVHPLQTQAVTYIYQRIESMTGMFCLVALACFAQAAATATQTRSSSSWPRAWLAGSVAAAAAAMASKESAAPLPLLILAYDWFFVEQPVGESWPVDLRRRRWAFYLPLFATWAIIGLQLRMQASQYQEFKTDTLTPFTYALTEAGVILHYLRLAVWPVGQCFDSSGWPVTTSVRQALPALAVILAMLAITAVGTIQRRPWAALGVLFFLALAPTSSIMPIEAVANEHRMYLALAAVAAAAVFGTLALAARINRTKPTILPRDSRLPLAIAGTVIMLLVVATQLRNQLYWNVTSFWLDVLRQDEGNHRANWSLAVVVDADGETDVATLLAEKAMEQKPSTPVFGTLATARIRIGDHATAERYLRRGLELQLAALPPDHRAVLTTTANLAVTLRLQGNRDEAERIARDSIDAIRRVFGPGDPFTISIDLLVAEGLSRAGEHDAAVARARTSLQIAERSLRPTAPETVNATLVLADCLKAGGKADEAERLLRSTLGEVMRSRTARPEDAAMLGNHLAALLEESGRNDESSALRRRFSRHTGR